MKVLLTIFMLATASASYGAPPKVLFIGNSYTHTYDLPGTLTRMAAPSGYPLDTDKYTAGGRTLKRHWDEALALAKIKDGTAWDIVVLQVYVDYPSAANLADMDTYARRFDAEIGAIGAKTIMFSHWGSHNAVDDRFWSRARALDTAVTQTAAGVGAGVAHAGLLWIYADEAKPSIRDTPPGIDLFGWSLGGDNSHPGPKGQYLSACYFYALLTARSPLGLSRGGENTDGNMDELISLEEAAELQSIAWDFYRKTHAAQPTVGSAQ